MHFAATMLQVIAGSAFGAPWPVRLGRADAATPGPAGRVPAADAPVEDIKVRGATCIDSLLLHGLVCQQTFLFIATRSPPNSGPGDPALPRQRTALA